MITISVVTNIHFLSRRITKKEENHWVCVNETAGVIKDIWTSGSSLLPCNQVCHIFAGVNLKFVPF